MSYNIGQYRRNYNFSYLNNIQYTIPIIKTAGIANETNTKKFNDRAIQVTTSFNYGSSYYVRIGIRRTDNEQKIDIGLKQ